jgi:hypothetical protein
MYSEEYCWAPDCANCGQEDKLGEYKGGRMTSTEWGHNYPCCSSACGKRLAVRIKNGMVDLSNFDMGHCLSFVEHYEAAEDQRIMERVTALRIRIKQLEHR